MIKLMNHMSFTVSNLNKSVPFYNEILGLKLMNIADRDPSFSEKVTGIKGAYLKIAYLKAPNCFLELVQYLHPEGKSIDTSTCNVGSAHVCFYINNFKSYMVRLRKNKVKIVNDPQIIPGGPNKGRLVVYTEDPDSNTIEFISTEIYKDSL
jgi:catechol 2,3-dioxygenase-like lactoylglutathione lyase family enzyme